MSLLPATDAPTVEVVTPRLGAAIGLVAEAARLYLQELQSRWGSAGDGRQPDDVERLVSGVGVVVPSHVAAADVRLADARRVLDRAAQDGLQRLATSARLGLGDQLLVAAVFGCHDDPQLATVFGCVLDDGARRHVTCGLLRRILGPIGIAVPPVLDDAHPLVTRGVVARAAGPEEPLALSATAIEILADVRPGHPLAERALAPRHAGSVERLARRVAESHRTVLVRGPRGSGRHAVAIAAAAATGRVAVDVRRPPAELALVAACTDVVPVVTLEDGQECPRADGAVFVGGPDARPPAAGATVIDLAAPDHRERVQAWERGLDRLGLTAGRDACESLAARFAFTEGDIAAVVAGAAEHAAAADRSVAPEDLWSVAREQPQHALETVAALVRPTLALDDLVLTSDVRGQLDELVAHVRHSHVVMERWGFRRSLPRGHGVAGLMTGPPGTGKTTAAEAVAAALGQDLYRIDLSRVVSKYIGETEKNLAVAFAEAERASAVLFFDEADALFGRRTEVRDSHDRYANLEINYLLQRVETFTGLVLLATNRHEALDDAFVRRLRFVIRFDPPDRDRRRELWRRAFPDGAPIRPLDLDALAQPDLTGGDINAAALRAAFLAAAGDREIRAADVATALEREFARLGRAWPGLTLVETR